MDDCRATLVVWHARARNALVALSCAAILQACGGGSGGEPPASRSTAGSGTTPPSASTNRPPSISGSPPLEVQAGTPYSFTPQASDPDGDALTFSIVNKPDWATFNTTTGQLTGTPTAASAGNFPGVTIRVSDGKETAELAPFAIFVNTIPSAIGRATISWLPPTTRSDGSALTNLAGYRIRYGTALGNYPSVVAIDNPSVTSYVVERLSGGMTYYFVVTAIDSAGVESDYSTPASKKID